MAVFISGTVLASLFYDHSVSICDQKGFLVGDVVSHVTDTISDSQMNNSEVETRIYVYDHVACPADRKIFDPQGNVQESQILDVLKEKHKSVVGWYSFRRGSTMRPSFRERLIHENLSLSISQDHQSDFVFMLCTSKFTTNLSTHSFDHGFLKLNNNVFKKVPMTVVNLGDTTHTEYRQIPSHTVSNTTGIYSLIVRQHEQEFLNAQGQVEINRITDLSNTLHRQLESISREVEVSERELAQLEAEVKKHQKEVKYKHLEQTAATSTVIHEKMDTDTNHPRQPSIDELLSMADIEGDPVTLNHATPNFDLSDTGLVSDSPKSSTEVTAYQMDTSQASSESDSELTKNKKEVKLTAAVSLHGKVDKKEGRSLSTSKSESAEPSVMKVAGGDKSGAQKSSDPFSFVSSMMQDSKTGEKVNTRSRSAVEGHKGDEVKRSLSTRHKGQGQSDSKVPQEKVVTVTRQKSNRESAAVLAAASAISNQGERSKSTRSQTKGQGQRDKLTEKSEIIDGELSEGNEKKRTKSMINDTAKHCSQEADEEKSQSSQDTYDMDVSSSPVY